MYCNLATIYAKDASNTVKIKQAKRLLIKALELNNSSSLKLEICIYLNLAAVYNQLQKYNDSLIVIEEGFEKHEMCK